MKKSTLITLVVFAGLLAGAVWSVTRKAERGITRVSLTAVKKEQIDRLELTGKNPIELKKQGDKWVLGNGKDADPRAVNDAVEAVARIDTSDLVTRNSERFADLEVNDEKGTRVKAFAGAQKVAEFVVGKAGPQGTHVRFEDEVYLVKALYPYVFSKQASAWHKLKLFEDKVEDVSRVEVALAGSPAYALVKDADKWKFEDPTIVPEGFRFDANTANALVSALVGLSAKEILEKDPGAETTKLGEGADKVAFVAKDGARREVLLGAAKDDGSLHAQVVGKPDVYLLATWTAKNVRKAASDLRDLSIVKLEKEKVKKLEVLDGKNQVVFEKQGADWKIATSSEKVPDDFQLDPGAVDRRLSSLATARAMKAADASVKATGLEKPQAQVKATLEDGTTVALLFGADVKDEGRDAFYARGNADPETYLVGKWVKDSLTGGLTTFKKMPPPQMPQGLPPGFNIPGIPMGGQ